MQIQLGLKRYGHKIERVDVSGIMQAIALDAEGKLQAVHDPRIPGKAARGVRSSNGK